MSDSSDEENYLPHLTRPFIGRGADSPIVEEPDNDLIVPAAAIVTPSSLDETRNIIVPRPRSRAVPLQGVLRHPSANVINNSGTVDNSTSTRRGSVEYTAGRLRFDNSIIQPVRTPPSLLQRQTVLSANPTNPTTSLLRNNAVGVVTHSSLNDVAHDFHDDLDNDNDGENDYSTPDWESAAVSERTQLAPSSGTGAYYNSLDSTGNTGSIGNSTPNGSGAGSGGPGGYEDEAFDDDDPLYIKSVYMLSCSILFIVSVVFVIIVSGLTTLYSRRNMPRFEIRSDWPRDGFIPDEYGCKAPGGVAKSIPIEWQNVPKKATNLVILFANADSVDVHWLVTDIPLQDSSGRHVFNLPANASENSALMPSAAKQRPNMHLKNGHYFPPCPKHNQTNMFVLHAYAIEAPARIDRIKEARQIMNGFVGVPSARYSGKYGGASRFIGDIDKHAAATADDLHHDSKKNDKHHQNDISSTDQQNLHPHLTHDQDLIDEKHGPATIIHP